MGVQSSLLGPNSGGASAVSAASVPFWRRGPEGGCSFEEMAEEAHEEDSPMLLHCSLTEPQPATLSSPLPSAEKGADLASSPEQRLPTMEQGGGADSAAAAASAGAGEKTFMAGAPRKLDDKAASLLESWAAAPKTVGPRAAYAATAGTVQLQVRNTFLEVRDSDEEGQDEGKPHVGAPRAKYRHRRVISEPQQPLSVQLAGDAGVPFGLDGFAVGALPSSGSRRAPRMSDRSQKSVTIDEGDGRSDSESEKEAGLLTVGLGTTGATGATATSGRDGSGRYARPKLNHLQTATWSNADLDDFGSTPPPPGVAGGLQGSTAVRHGMREAPEDPAAAQMPPVGNCGHLPSGAAQPAQLLPPGSTPWQTQLPMAGGAAYGAPAASYPAPASSPANMQQALNALLAQWCRPGLSPEQLAVTANIAASAFAGGFEAGARAMAATSLPMQPPLGHTMPAPSTPPPPAREATVTPPPVGLPPPPVGVAFDSPQNAEKPASGQPGGSKRPVPCKWFSRGTCKFGRDCRFAHTATAGATKRSNSSTGARAAEVSERVCDRGSAMAAGRVPLPAGATKSSRSPSPLVARGDSKTSMTSMQAASDASGSRTASPQSSSPPAPMTPGPVPREASPQPVGPVRKPVRALRQQQQPRQKPAAAGAAARGGAQNKMPEGDLGASSPAEVDTNSDDDFDEENGAFEDGAGGRSSCHIIWCDHRAFKADSEQLKVSLKEACASRGPPAMAVSVKGHKTAEKCMRLLRKKRQARERSQAARPACIYLVSYANALPLVPYLAELRKTGRNQDFVAVVVFCDLCGSKGRESAQRLVRDYDGMLLTYVATTWEEAAWSVAEASARAREACAIVPAGAATSPEYI
eukprot:TRINITY_DN122266_c0_g1_i1.p1 TRINITY_DN122266_c0_g1~~TRINITY_DN122266_c0_g1_i1.p1  ORF type:complete len:974 (-),score=209.81 TRINITY_DN122266_c0_g1_i1:87-2675(-)